LPPYFSRACVQYLRANTSWSAAFILVVVLTSQAWTQTTEKVLVHLPVSNFSSGLVFDQHGNLYGADSGTGLKYGNIFEARHLANGSWSFRNLHVFTGGSDGEYPHGHLLWDSKGNLYGATSDGGLTGCAVESHSCGAVFELTQNPNGTWTRKTLYAFTGAADGANPASGLAWDAKGNLYGTTAFGGLGQGTVFQLHPQPDGTWSEITLYQFTGGTDGRGAVNDALAIDTGGNVYGTTLYGGNTGHGTVFRLSPNLTGSWDFRVLYSFCPNAGCRDGSTPVGVVLDSHGNLYGAASSGGLAQSQCSLLPNDCGTVYKIWRNTWKFQLLHRFCAGDCSDGARPVGLLTFDSSGNLYGSTIGNHGTVFRLSHPAGSPWTVTTLYQFCQLPQCADGFDPGGSPILDAGGNLYGITSTLVYEVSP